MMLDSILYSNQKRTHHGGYRIGDKVRIKSLDIKALVIGYNYWSANGIYIETIKGRQACSIDNLEMITRIEDQKYSEEIIQAIKFNS